MTNLISHIKEYLLNHISNTIESTRENSLRLVFGAPPKKLLTELFDAILAGKSQLEINTPSGIYNVPVYLVDQYADDPHESSTAAICTPSYLVNIRNNHSMWLALIEVGASTNASLTSTVNPVGITEEISDFDDWYDMPIIKFLVDTLLERLDDQPSADKLRPAIEFALHQSWSNDERNKDKRTVWAVLEKLHELESVSKNSVLATLGLVNCEDQKRLGSEKHLKTILKIADHFQSAGLRAGLDELEQSDDEKIISSVQKLREHFTNVGLLDASEFCREPLLRYSPISQISKDIPPWWFELDLDVWQNLLESNDDNDKPENGKLEVELVNGLVPVPKGLLPIVQNHVELDISIKDITEDTAVRIERSNGNAQKHVLYSELVAPGKKLRFSDLDIPEHRAFIKYVVYVDGHEPVTLKVIILDSYLPGVVVVAPSALKASAFKVNNKARDIQNRKISRNECNIHLPGMGSHYLNLFTASSVELEQMVFGYEIDAENIDVIEKSLNKISDNHYSCLIETDEECHYEFSSFSKTENSQSLYRVYLTAEELKQTGATSEFDRLIITHRASATSSHSSPRVDPLNCRAMDLEMWIVEDQHSFMPLILGPDYIKKWQKPSWSEMHKFSELPMLIDPRPTKGDFNVPEAYLNSRNRVLSFINTPEDEVTPSISVIEFFKLMKSDEFVVAVEDLLDAYLNWLQTDYDVAAWTDIVSVHDAQPNSKALESTPYAILLSPMHPIRLAWQCCSQKVLQDALDKHSRCPAASVINSNSFPDCFVLPCKNATGSIDNKPFASMASSSDYWGVLCSVESSNSEVFTTYRSIFGEDLGISVEGIASGFSAQQVVRSLDETSRLMAAKSTLRIGVTSDTGGSSSCNEGIETWCTNNLGPEVDDWQIAGPKSLVINDLRDNVLQPEQAVLASLTSRTSASVRWFTGKSPEMAHENDLSIIAHLSTMDHSFHVQGIRSAIDSSGLSRWRVRKQLPSQNVAFIAESRIGEIPTLDSGLPIKSKLMKCVDKIERQCRDKFDSYVFAPDMTTLSDVIEKSKYTALSSSNVDAACFFGATQKSYLWDYELPSYSRRSGENTGYYLLAKESTGMLKAVKSALSLLGDHQTISEQRISCLLREISRRGMPTLKRLTAGGTMSLGEIGMLTALRILQSEFDDENASGLGVLPALEDETINLVISADPFQKHIDDLRSAIGFKYGERPDLIVLSVKFDSGVPCRLKITPIEVKARGGAMSLKDKVSALAQASHFSEFLQEIKSRASDVELWGIAWRNLLASMLDYSFRIYGQLDSFMNHEEWAKQHSQILKAVSNESIDLQVDSQGRLILIDNSSGQSLQDIDSDSFYETMVLTHQEALSVLADDYSGVVTAVKNKVGDWSLKPEYTEEAVIKIGDGSNSHPTNPEPVVEPFPEQIIAPTPEIVIEPEPQVDSSQGVKFVVGETINQFSSENLSFFPSNTNLNHLNVGIVGDLGTGKTQLIKALIKQLTDKPELNRGKQPNILIFDYKRDYSKADFVEATGARVVKPFDIPLNLFDTRDSGDPKRAWLQRSRFFIDILNKIYSGIGPVQQQRIKDAVKLSYKNAEANNQSAPTLNDVFDAYKQAAGGVIDTPYNIMDDLIDGEYFVSDQSQVIPFSKFVQGIVVIDLAEVGQDDRTKNMLVVIFLNLFYDHMLKIQKRDFIGTDPQLRFIDTMLLVDEADNIMKYEFDVLKKILLQGREFGVGVLMASQYLSHFKTSHENYLEPLLSWFIHKVPNVSVKELEAIGLTNVNADVVDQIKNLNCHECLFKTLDVSGKIIRAKPFYELSKVSK